MDGQDILRVNQVVDFRQYGKKTIINKIKTLNKHKYVEEKIKEINSDIFNNAYAAHNLSCIEELTTFDYICKT